MPSSLNNQKALLNQAMKAEESWHLDTIVSLRTPDARYQLLPKSLGWPSMNNTAFKERLGALVPVFAGNYRIDILSVLHDAEAHSAVVYCHNTAHTSTPAGLFDVETIWLCSFTEDGTKITDVKEYIDSAYLTQWVEKLEGGGEAA